MDDMTFIVQYYLRRLCDLRVTAHGEEVDDRVGWGRGVRQTVEEACYWLLAKTVATNHSNEALRSRSAARC